MQAIQIPEGRSITLRLQRYSRTFKGRKSFVNVTDIILDRFRVDYDIVNVEETRPQLELIEDQIQ